MSETVIYLSIVLSYYLFYFTRFWPKMDEHQKHPVNIVYVIINEFGFFVYMSSVIFATLWIGVGAITGVALLLFGVFLRYSFLNIRGL